MENNSFEKLKAFLRYLAFVDFCYPFIMAMLFFFGQAGKTPDCFTKALGYYSCSPWEYAWQGFYWNFLLFTLPIAVFLFICWFALVVIQKIKTPK